MQNGCPWSTKNADAECQQWIHTGGTQGVIFGCLLIFLELKPIYFRQPCTWWSSGCYTMRKLISGKLRAAVAGLFSGLSAVAGWVSSQPWKHAAPLAKHSHTSDTCIYSLDIPRGILTPENVCGVSVVRGVSFAEAVDLVTDPLGQIFIDIIWISRSAGFTWCLRGAELTVLIQPQGLMLGKQNYRNTLPFPVLALLHCPVHYLNFQCTSDFFLQ